MIKRYNIREKHITSEFVVDKIEKFRAKYDIYPRPYKEYFKKSQQRIKDCSLNSDSRHTEIKIWFPKIAYYLQGKK